MPEGMDTQLSRQDLSDLIAFLQSLRYAQVSAMPAAVTCGVACNRRST